jgi:uncharacterized protein (DUF2141 family)
MRWLAPMLLLLAGTDPGIGSIEVEVRGLAPHGVLWIALHDQPSAFPNDFRRASQKRTVHVSGSVQRLRFEGVRYGWYAISAVQDVNENGRIDTGLFGRPTEPYGISNGSRGLPTFDAAKFAVDQPTVTEVIELIH